ncbi:hypothetical protein [Streptomyces capparidis]
MLTPSPRSAAGALPGTYCLAAGMAALGAVTADPSHAGVYDEPYRLHRERCPATRTAARTLAARRLEDTAG